jgi:hypothetical protein
MERFAREDPGHRQEDLPAFGLDDRIVSGRAPLLCDPSDSGWQPSIEGIGELDA